MGGSNFLCPPLSAACDSDVAAGTTLSFAGCSGVLGSAGCLSQQEGIDVTSPLSQASVGESNFLTFSNNANLVYSLMGIFTGTNTDCLSLTVGNSCYIYPGAALQLTLEQGGTSRVSITMTGRASDTGVAGLATASAYIGSFSQSLTANLPDGSAPTPADIQNYFCGTNTVTSVLQCLGTQSITSSQSGSFTAVAIPEPSAIGLSLMGGILIVAARIRRKKP